MRRWLLILIGTMFLLFLCWIALDAFETAKPELFERVVARIGDDLDHKLKRVSGSHAIDCGRVRLRESPAAVSKCAMDANSQDKPFRARFDLKGIDAALAVGFARSPEGKLYAFDWDGNPYGGGYTLLFGQRLITIACPEKPGLYVDKLGQLNCIAPDPNYQPSIMDPQAEPY